MHFELWPQFSDFARFLCAFALKESYPSSVHRALRYDQSPFSGPPKVRDSLIFVRNLLPSVNNRTKQARFSQK